MKFKWIFAVLVVGLLGGAWWNFNSFDADRFVEKSIFKGRTFSGKVEEVSAFDGKVKAYLMQEHSLPIVS